MLKIDEIAFLATRRFRGIQVPTSPHFEHAQATEWFVGKLEESRRYLEFGTGGSTYLAAKLGIPFFAVDSDPFFLDAVRAKIQEDGWARPTGQVFHYADIGLTGKWGRPIGPIDSVERQTQLRRYSDPPRQAFDGDQFPDLILVDGRFRIACVLKSLRLLATRRDWTIAVDDYTQRPAYQAITEFADIDEFVCNRIAVIRSAKKVDERSLDRAIEHFETVLD